MAPRPPPLRRNPANIFYAHSDKPTKLKAPATALTAPGNGPTYYSTRRDVIEAAMNVADEAAQGRLRPTDLEAAAVQECRTLFGAATGPNDPLWPVQVEVCRSVLACVFRGIPADELTEWLAVARQRAAAPTDVLD